MAEATMTSKGQITIPKEMRDDLGLKPGSKVMFIKLSSGQYRILPRTGKVRDLVGLLHDPTRPVLTLEEMEDAIQEGWAKSGLHGSPGYEDYEPL